MCMPNALAMAGIATALAGSVVKARATNHGINAATNASDKVLSRDTQRQRGLEDERRAILAASLSRQGAPAQTNDMNTRRQEIEADYATAAAPDTTSRDTPPSQNAGAGQGAVNQEYARSLADALNSYKKSSASQAKVKSYDANKTRLGIALAGNGSQIALNAGLANADNQAANIEAQRRYTKKMKKVGQFGLGDALQMGGTAASMAGAAGAGPSYDDIGGYFSPDAAYTAGTVNPATGMFGHI